MAFMTAEFDVSKTPVTSTALQAAAKKAVNTAAKKSANLRELVTITKETIESSNGLGWHVLGGKDFAVDLRYRKGACVLLSSKTSKVKVLLYRTTPALTPLPTKDHEALVNASSSSLKYKIKWFDSDMSDEMQELVASKVQSLYEQYQHAADVDTKMAQALKHSMTFAYGHTWQVIVATTRELFCAPHYEPETFGDLTIDNKIRVILYRHGGADLDSHLDVTQFGHKLLLLLAAVCVVVYGYLSITTTDLHVRCNVDTSSKNETTPLLPEDCTEDQMALAKVQTTWKFGAFIGIILFTVLGSFLRIYMKTLRQKAKHL